VSPDDVILASNVSYGSEMQRQNDDGVMTLIVGVTLGGLSLMAVFIVTCVVWLVHRRRRRHSQSASHPTSGHENTRLDPETTENRLNESSTLPRNNAVTSPCGRYTKDGTLVLTVTNDCTGNGNDVMQCAGGASDIKKDNYASASTSSGKSGVGAVNNDVSRSVRMAADDVNVWPYGDADQCDARAPCDGVQRGRKFADDFRRSRRGSASSVCDDDGKSRSKNPHKANASTENDDHWSSRVRCRTSR